jgi:hypothetical protein
VRARGVLPGANRHRIIVVEYSERSSTLSVHLAASLVIEIRLTVTCTILRCCWSRESLFSVGCITSVHQSGRY